MARQETDAQRRARLTRTVGVPGVSANQGGTGPFWGGTPAAAASDTVGTTGGVGAEGGTVGVGAAGGTASSTGPAPRDTRGDDSARAIIASVLGEVGGAAWQRYLETESATLVVQEFRAGAEWSKGAYARTYPGIRPGQNEGDYRATIEAYKQRLRRFSIPEDMFDEASELSGLIAKDVSPDEFEDRLEMRAQAVSADPKAVALREGLAVNGISNAEGLTLAFWINPDKGTDIIKKTFRAGESYALAQRAGFGNLTAAESQRVAGGGYTDDYLTGQFGKLASYDEFLVDLPGGADDNVTREDLLSGGIEGNADAIERIERTRRRRQAQFDGGGGFAAGQGGISGLGSAS